MSFQLPMDPISDPERRKARERRRYWESVEEVAKKARELPEWLKLTPEGYEQWLKDKKWK